MMSFIRPSTPPSSTRAPKDRRRPIASRTLERRRVSIACTNWQVPASRFWPLARNFKVSPGSFFPIPGYTTSERWTIELWSTYTATRSSRRFLCQRNRLAMCPWKAWRVGRQSLPLTERALPKPFSMVKQAGLLPPMRCLFGSGNEYGRLSLSRKACVELAGNARLNFL